MILRRDDAKQAAGILAAAVIALAGVALWWIWSPPSVNELVGGDEGYYGTMARNVLAGPRWLVSPSLQPMGPAGDKPPLYPALLAASIRAFGVNETAVRAPSYLFAAVTVAATAAAAGMAGGPLAAVACALLLVTLPWFADASRLAGGEIPLTAFAALALAVLLRDPSSRRRAIVAGSLLGAAFLCKLWLDTPVVIACVVAIVSARPKPGVLFAFVLTACAVSAIQLGAVALFDRASLGHWFQIYFGRSLAERASGQGYADFWIKHPAFYWSMLVHAFALLAPLAFLGLEAAVSRAKESATSALLTWAAGVLLLSAFTVKAGGYAYVVVPAWVGLAALGAAAMFRGERPSWMTIVLGALVTAPPLLPDAAGARLSPMVWLVTWAAFTLAWLAVGWRPAASKPLAILLVGVVAVGGAVRARERLAVPFHQPGYRAVAAAIEPVLSGLPPDRACLVTPEAPAMAFYLFRAARYWGTPVEPWSAERAASVRADSALRVFVIDPARRLYGGWPDSATVAWLEATATEITEPVRARAAAPLELRVFRR